MACADGCMFFDDCSDKVRSGCSIAFVFEFVLLPTERANGCMLFDDCSDILWSCCCSEFAFECVLLPMLGCTGGGGAANTNGCIVDVGGRLWRCFSFKKLPCTICMYSQFVCMNMHTKKELISTGKHAKHVCVCASTRLANPDTHTCRSMFWKAWSSLRDSLLTTLA